MRTTLAIDDDILATARAMAEREHRSIGEVISALARQALRRDPAQAVAPTVRNGITLLPARAGVPPATLELVNRMRDEP